MNTRNGKIARLPQAVREQLNRRLDDAEPGKHLVEWLNSVPPVTQVLVADFGGRPINEQNLTEWRQGGYLDWQKQQERRQLVRQLTEDAGTLLADAAGVEISNHLSAILTVELAESAQELLATITDPSERWERLQELLRELARMRREDQRAGRLQIERERRAQERLKEERQEASRREHEPFSRLLRRSFMADLYAQPDFTSQAMATVTAESLLQEPELHESKAPGGLNPDQTQSN